MRAHLTQNSSAHGQLSRYSALEAGTERPLNLEAVLSIFPLLMKLDQNDKSHQVKSIKFVYVLLFMT